MGDVIQIEWGQLDMLFEDMEKVRGYIGDLDTYFGDHVCNPAGFDFEPFALKPLADAMTSLRGFFGDVKDTFETRYDGLVHAAAVTARDFDLRDGQVSYDFSALLGGPQPAPATPPGTGPGVEIRGITLSDPNEDLKAPEEGKQRFPTEHDAPFQAVNAGWDAARDKVNECIRWCRDHGIDIFDELPEKSLEAYIVFPLTGDYYAIQQNASACRHFARGLRTFAANFAELAGKALLAMQGLAGGALAGHIGLYGVVLGAVSAVIDGLAKVFDELAEMSEKLATKVEKIIRVLGQKLLKLMKFLLKRINAAVGIFTTIKEIAEKGAAFFTDLVDDVKTVGNLIKLAFDLVDEVEAWAAEQSDRIETAKQVAAIAKKLPHARASMDLSDLAKIDPQKIERSLDALEADFGDPEGDAWDKLEGKVDEGVDEADPEYAPPPNPDCLPAPPTDIFGHPIVPEEWHPPMAAPQGPAPAPAPEPLRSGGPR